MIVKKITQRESCSLISERPIWIEGRESNKEAGAERL